MGTGVISATPSPTCHSALRLPTCKVPVGTAGNANAPPSPLVAQNRISPVSSHTPSSTSGTPAPFAASTTRPSHRTPGPIASATSNSPCPATVTVSRAPAYPAVPAVRSTHSPSASHPKSYAPPSPVVQSDRLPSASVAHTATPDTPSPPAVTVPVTRVNRVASSVATSTAPVTDTFADSASSAHPSAVTAYVPSGQIPSNANPPSAPVVSSFTAAPADSSRTTAPVTAIPVAASSSRPVTLPFSVSTVCVENPAR